MIMSSRTSPDSAVFRVTVIGSHDNQLTGDGTLETTPTTLIFTDTQESKFTWDLATLKKYGSNGEEMFTVETDQSAGGGVYIFSTPHAPYLEDIVSRHLAKCSSPARSTNGRIMARSSSLWSLPGGQYPVVCVREDSETREGLLEITAQDIVYTDGQNGQRHAWPIAYLRRYGYDRGVFSFDASSRCPGGAGVFAFKSPKAAEIQDKVRKNSRSVFGSTMNLSSPGKGAWQGSNMSLVSSYPEPKRIPLRSETDDSPRFKRTNSFLRRARSAMDLTRNLFDVTNISDERRAVGKGTLEVSQADLIYVDHNTEEKWRWPLRYLRRYGCDGHVFSFEAGRRCPGGEGLYAFSTPRASEIRQAILHSINNPQRSHDPLSGSTMSLAEPARRSSDQVIRTPGRKGVPLPPTPPKSPVVQSNDEDSSSSGVLTPPPGGVTTPPPKPPRSGERRKKKPKKDKTPLLPVYDTPTKPQPPPKPSTPATPSKPATPPKPSTKKTKAAKKTSFLKLLKRSTEVAPVQQQEAVGLYANMSVKNAESATYANMGVKTAESASYTNMGVKTAESASYANMSVHRSINPVIDRQGSVEVGVVSSVPGPHRGNSPPPQGNSPPPNSANMYANVSVAQPMTYADIEIMNSPPNGTPVRKSHEQPTKSPDPSVASHDPKEVSHDDSVEYQTLNFQTMFTLQCLGKDRGKKEHFAEMLNRHEVTTLDNRGRK